MNESTDYRNAVEARRLWYLNDEVSVSRHMLGEGGFSDVYEGHVAASGEKVAVKLLRRPTDSTPSEFSKIRKRFVREVELLAGLELDGIVKPFSAQCVEIDSSKAELNEKLGGDYAMAAVFQIVDGKPLTNWTPGNQLELKEFFLELTQTIRSLHEKGILHRDLKLSNVFRSNSGRPVVVDFGLATSKFDSEELTTIDESYSSKAYDPLPPLQKMNESHDVRRIGEMMEKLSAGRSDLESVNRIASRIAEGKIETAQELENTLARSLQKSSQSLKSYFVVGTVLAGVVLAGILFWIGIFDDKGKVERAVQTDQSEVTANQHQAFTLTKVGYPLPYHLGCKLIRQGKLGEASKQFGKLKTALPAYWEMGNAHLCDAGSDYEGAIKHYVLASQESPPPMAKWLMFYGLQDCMKKIGKFEESDEYANQLLALVPEQAIHHRYRFNCFVLLGQKEAALEEAKKGILKDEAYVQYFRQRIDGLGWSNDGIEE